jgi:hypothetical protein
MRVYLDDLRTPPEEDEYDIICRNANAAIALIEAGLVSLISFDHDLGDAAAPTGYDVAKFVERRAAAGILPPAYAIHSANPVGMANIAAAMESAYKLYINSK